MWQKLLAGALLVAGVVSCLSKPDRAPVVGLTAGDALYVCAQALRGASKDPERAEVPGVPAVLSGDEFGFSWGRSTKMLRLRNGLGLEVAASAYCAVNRSSGRVVALSLNGQSMI